MSTGPDQYGDLLIFEESLRKEYTRLTILKRKYTLFFAALIAWNAFFFHGVFLQPSAYHYVSFFYRIGLLAGLVTLVLFYASGLYNSTLVQPRKFIPQANRGLRHFNVKLVPMRTGWLSLFKRDKPGEGKVKLVVSSKAGSPEVREGFEEYRNAYWQAVQEKLSANAKSATPTASPHASQKQSRKHDGERPVRRQVKA